MRVLYVCLAVDETNPALATQVSWIRTLAEHPRVESVHVLTPKLGPANLPANADVTVFGRRGRTSVLGFLRAVLRARRTAWDVALVTQGGPWPALLLPFKLVTGRPIYQWKADPRVTTRMRWYVRYCSDLVFTATPSSLPIESRKIRVVGHGIDTHVFRPGREPATLDLVTVGRISPVKRIEQMIDAIAACERRHGARYALDVVGACTPSANLPYRDALVRRAEEHGIGDRIHFTGPRSLSELPALLTKYRAALNFSATALDKAAVEAMAAGVPVVATNPCVAEILPDRLTARLVVPDGDTDAQADLIHTVLSAPESERRALGDELRAIVERDHDVHSQFDRMVDAIDTDRRRRRQRPRRRRASAP